MPNPNCYERTANNYHPFIYKPKQDGHLLLRVDGLDSTRFEVTILNEDDSLNTLEDGVAFSYVMDVFEKRVDFKITVKEKKDVSFNLVAPLNDLKLMVQNTDDEIDDDEAQTSA